MTIQGVPQLHECRQEVLAFARLMEYKLRLNDHKGGWKDWVPEEALRRLLEEAGEIGDELRPPDQRCNCREAGCMHVSPWWKPNPERVGFESADAGNFAMMIADMCGSLAGLMESPVLYTAQDFEQAFRRWIASGAPGTMQININPESAWQHLSAKLQRQPPAPGVVAKCDYCGCEGQVRGTPILADVLVKAKMCETCWNTTREGGLVSEEVDIGPFKPPAATTNPGPLTWWNGERCSARTVTVTVADDPQFPQYWAKGEGLIGQDHDRMAAGQAAGGSPDRRCSSVG